MVVVVVDVDVVNVVAANVVVVVKLDCVDSGQRIGADEIDLT